MTDTETSQESFGKSPDSILQSNFEEPGEGKYVSHEEIKLLSDEIKKTKDDAKETKENINKRLIIKIDILIFRPLFSIINNKLKTNI